jgi:hypothetical protein
MECVKKGALELGGEGGKEGRACTYSGCRERGRVLGIGVGDAGGVDSNVRRLLVKNLF